MLWVGSVEIYRLQTSPVSLIKFFPISRNLHICRNPAGTDCLMIHRKGIVYSWVGIFFCLCLTPMHMLLWDTSSHKETPCSVQDIIILASRERIWTSNQSDRVSRPEIKAPSGALSQAAFLESLIRRKHPIIISLVKASGTPWGS